MESKMSTINHLKRMAKILWKHYENEIKEEEDWYWAGRKWEINFTLDDDSQTIVAYKRKGCETDWSNYITLVKKVRKWETVEGDV